MNRPAESFQSKAFREYGIVLLLLAAAILLFWWRVWIPSPMDRMHFSDDIFIKDYPARMGLFRQALDGQLPLWDPYQFGGWPGLANCEAGVFYPFNWILIPFSHSPQAAFQVTQWIVLLHFLIGGLGTYRYARSIGLSPLASGFASMAFTFCGFLCAHKKHTNMIFTLVWFPWILWQVERWIRERRANYLFNTTVLLALSYFAGHPQSSLYLTILAAVRLFCGYWERGYSPTPNKRGWFKYGIVPILGVVLLAVSLSAIQYIPTRELIAQSERSEADTFQRSSEFSLPPAELLDAFLPETLSAWPQTEVFYWGLAPLLLALRSFQRGGFNPLDRYWLGVLIASVLLSLGGYLFVFDLSYLLIPGAAWVRAPSRWIYFAGLPLALAAAREIDFLLREDRIPERLLRLTSYWKIVGALSGLAALAFFYGVIATDVSVPQDAKLAARRDQFQSFLYMILFGGAFLSLYQLTLRQRMRPSLFAAAIIAVTWIDLGTHYNTLDLLPGAGGYTADTEVKFLRESVWNHRTKVYFQAGGNRALYHGAAQNFYELDGQSPLTPRLHLELREDTALPFPAKPNQALYRMLGVGSVLTDVDGFPASWKRETRRLYRIEEPVARAWECPERFLAGWREQRDIVRLQSFPFERIALTGEKPSAETLPERRAGTLFPKPFLLASCSINAVSPNALLVVDGKNHFEDKSGEAAGYCVTVADPLTGEIEDAQTFNLMDGLLDPDREIHQRLVDFIQDIPEGKIVFAAVKDNAADSLLPAGLSALRAIGASLDARGRFRLAHAIIGRKGAPIGSALEVFSATEAMILQTESTLTIEGQVVEKPAPSWIATTNLADTWNSTIEQIDEDLPSPLLYEVAEEIRQSTDPLSVDVPITIFSAPKKEVAFPTRDLAVIKIANRDYSFNRRGYNLAVVEPETFRVVERNYFDLFRDFDSAASPSFIRPASPENNRMSRFIRSVTDGFLILGAIRDDATDLMTPDTLDALHEIGSALTFDRFDPMARKRISHAFIAVKGASRCIEAFEREKDAIVFTRYPGGPALSHSELKTEGSVFVPANPIGEMEELIESRRAIVPTAKRPGREKNVWAVVEDSIRRIRLSGNSEGGGMVFIGEIFFPGWKSYVDGVVQPIQRVNYYFRGIEVPPGRHDIELVYAPASFRLGATISLIGLIALIGWWIAIRLTANRKPVS